MSCGFYRSVRRSVTFMMQACALAGALTDPCAPHVKQEYSREESRMKRSDIKSLLPEADDSIIDAIFSMHGSDLNAAKEKSEAALAELAEKAGKFDEIEKARMTAEEKAAKAIEKAEAMQKEFAVKSNMLEVSQMFTEAGISKEGYEPLLASLVTADLEKSKEGAETFISFLTAQKEATEKSLRAELMKDMEPPAAGGSGGNEMTKAKFHSLPMAEKQAYIASNPNWKSDLE